MIKRRCGQFNPAAVSGVTVGRYDAGEEALFHFEQSFQVCAFEISAFLNELGNLRIIKKKLVEPYELGQDLKIGEVLCLEVPNG